MIKTPPSRCPSCGVAGPHDINRKADEWSLYRCEACLFEFWWPFDPEFLYRTRGTGELVFNAAIFHVFEGRHKHALRSIRHHQIHRLLDVGCRGGAFPAAVAECGIEAWGLDREPKILEAATRLYSKVNFVAQDIHAFSQGVDLKPFDCITVFDVFEHFGDPKTLIDDILRCLRVGGLVVLTVPNLERLGGYDRSNVPPYHWTRWTQRTLASFLENNGFEVLECRSVEAGPRQVLDVLGFGQVSDQKKTAESSQTREVDVSYRPHSPLGKVLRFGIRPFLKLIEITGRAHTLYAVGRKKPQKAHD
jgi:SAM-dependent methyltransferase